MKRVTITKETSLAVTGIAGFLKRKVTKFGTGAKVDCPKKYKKAANVHKFVCLQTAVFGLWVVAVTTTGSLSTATAATTELLAGYAKKFHRK